MPVVNVKGGTQAVYFDPSNPAVAATFSGTLAAVPTTGSGDAIYEETGNWTRVNIAGSQTAASLLISGQQAAGTNRPFIVNTDGAIKVYDMVTGTIATVSAVTNITNSIAVHVLSTGGTLAVKIDPSYNVVNASSTILLPSVVSGSFAGVSTLGTVIVAPEAGRNIKVYAYSLSTTGIVPITPSFTNGAGAAPTEFWRVALQAISASNTGANLSIMPPGYLFATGSNTTLALRLDSGTLVHFSVAYFKESA